MISFEQIKKANESIITTDIKGKDYAEVNQRIKAFRMCYPNGTITTEIINLENGVVTMKAIVSNEEGVVIGTGFAQEKENSTFINKTSYIENCETSAVGRALGMCGFGIDTSVASYEEVMNAMENQKEDSSTKKTTTEKKPTQTSKKEAAKQDTVVYCTKEQLEILNRQDEPVKAFALKKFNVASLDKLTSEQAAYIIKSMTEKGTLKQRGKKQ